MTVERDGAARLGAVVRLTESPQPATSVQTSTRSGTLSEFLGLATASNELVTTFDQVAGSLTDAVFRRVSLSAFGTPMQMPAVRPCPAPNRPVTVRVLLSTSDHHRYEESRTYAPCGGR